MKPFSHYKNSIDSILENSFKNTEQFKKNLSVVMGAMKYSKTLREFFTLYNDIESKKFKSEEERKMAVQEANFYRINLVFSGEEADVVKQALGKTPAEALLAMCKA